MLTFVISADCFVAHVAIIFMRGTRFAAIRQKKIAAKTAKTVRPREENLMAKTRLEAQFAMTRWGAWGWAGQLTGRVTEDGAAWHDQGMAPFAPLNIRP